MNKELWIKIIIFVLVAILLIFEGIDTLPVEGIGTSPGPMWKIWGMIITKIFILILVWIIIVIEWREKRPKIQG